MKDFRKSLVVIISLFYLFSLIIPAISEANEDGNEDIIISVAEDFSIPIFNVSIISERECNASSNEYSLSIINVQEVWEQDINGSGTKISIIDTGISHHPDLEEMIIAEKDFTGEGTEDLNGHGTFVAGIVASIAPGAELMNIKCLGKDATGIGSDAISAIEWSIDNGADIIVCSFGAEGPCDGDCPLCEEADSAVKNGVVVVAAAGNDGPLRKRIDCPGNAHSVIAVGASDSDDFIPLWSGRGPTKDGRVKPDLVAPGINIKSTYLDGKYAYWSGTSFAAPQVAGAAALLLQAKNLAPAQIKDALLRSAKDLGYDSYSQGTGRLDVYETYRYIQGEVSLEKPSFPVSSPPDDDAEALVFDIGHLISPLLDIFIQSDSLEDLPIEIQNNGLNCLTTKMVGADEAHEENSTNEVKFVWNDAIGALEDYQNMWVNK